MKWIYIADVDYWLQIELFFLDENKDGWCHDGIRWKHVNKMKK